MNDKSNLTSVWITVGFMLLFVAQIFLYRQPIETIAYSDFHQLAGCTAARQPGDRPRTDYG